MNDQIDQEPNGPWYTEQEARSLGALTNEHGQIVDAAWSRHLTKPLWRRTEDFRQAPNFGTMA